MRRHLAPALLVAFAAAVAAAVPSLAPGRTAAAREAEAARIEQRLQRIEARVLATDAELRSMDRALGAELLDAMEEVRPGVADDALRLAELRAGGREEAGAVDAAEIRRLEDRVERARLAAMREHRLATMLDAFHQLLREKMVRADPQAGPLFERYAELHRHEGAAP